MACSSLFRGVPSEQCVAKAAEKHVGPCQRAGCRAGRVRFEMPLDSTGSCRENPCLSPASASQAASRSGNPRGRGGRDNRVRERLPWPAARNTAPPAAAKYEVCGGGGGGGGWKRCERRPQKQLAFEGKKGAPRVRERSVAKAGSARTPLCRRVPMAAPRNLAKAKGKRPQAPSAAIRSTSSRRRLCAYARQGVVARVNSSGAAWRLQQQPLGPAPVARARRAASSASARRICICSLQFTVYSL
jgi:hypothetical protein